MWERIMAWINARLYLMVYMFLKVKIWIHYHAKISNFSNYINLFTLNENVNIRRLCIDVGKEHTFRLANVQAKTLLIKPLGDPFHSSLASQLLAQLFLHVCVCIQCHEHTFAILFQIINVQTKC